jgi:DNA repair exonuclease SbcCD ATPase subunit
LGAKRGSDTGEQGEGEMRSTREARKARLMERVEAAVDELLDWEEATDKPNLTQIEEKVLKLRKQVSQEMALEVIRAQEARRPVPGPQCRGCGQEMRYKGQKEVNPLSWVGELKIERGHYHCPKCKESLFPPG